jgi:DNA-binding MarR family transcriptional regulator
MSPGALAEHERTKPPSMTRMVNTLAELGLVEKVEHPTDRRQVVVRLTEAGAREVAETRRRRDAWLTQQLSDLTPDERETLARATDLLTRIAAR